MATQKEISEHLGLSDRHVRRLQKNAVLPASKGSGGYDVDASRLAYCDYLRGLVSGQVQADTDELSVKDEQARNLRARSELLELDLAIKEKEYVPISLLVDALSHASTGIVRIFDAIVPNIKQRFPDINPEHLAEFQKQLALARNCAAAIRYK